MELNSGTLTLKAGSRVYVPNGTGVFDEVVFSSDITVSSQPNDTRMYCFKSDGSYLRLPKKLIFSGSTAPTSIGQYGAWYDTANNLVKYTTNSGSTWTSGYSLPAFIATGDGSSVTSIDQIFNGFGYMGSTLFVLPGVKGQYANGRNADGTCKSVVTTTTKVYAYTPSYGSTNYYNIGVWLRSGGTFTTTNGFYYDPDKNQIIYSPDNNAYTNICIAKFDWVDGKITSFTSCNVDSVANSNASNFSAAGRSYLSGIGALNSSHYINVTLLASGQEYTAPGNGYFSISKQNTAAGQYLGFYNCGASYQWASVANQYIRITTPLLKKGTKIGLEYNANGNLQFFNFIYAEGEN